MKINSNSVQETMNFLNAQIQAGNEYVAFPLKNGILSKAEMYCHPALYDTEKFCSEKFTDKSQYKCYRISAVVASMGEALSKGHTKNGQGGVTDIGAMTEAYILKQNNYEYLCRQLLYSGFGESLNEQLKQNIEKGENDFTLSLNQQFGKDFADAKLYFSKSEKGYYFFNKFDLKVLLENKPDKIFTQTFYNGRDNSYTLKEGYNLLCDRAVNKDKSNKAQETYNVWDKLDFTEKNKYGNYPTISYGDKYGFNLERELEKHAIKALKNPDDRKLLIDSMKKGNRQYVKVEQDGKTQERYIEANPKMRRIDIYDKDGKAITNQNKQTPGKAQENKESKDVTAEDGEQKKGKNTRNKKGATV